MPEKPAADRCPSTSPIQKFDEGPRQCRKEKGHAGPHYALTSDGKYVDTLYDYACRWDDEGRWVRD
jgi:hypothetical protein